MKCVKAKTRAEALKKAGLGADAITVKVEGRYLIFETVAELRSWTRPKKESKMFLSNQANPKRKD